MPESRPTVLILGAGVNGCAVARELVLNGVGVCVVDRHDIAYGASSRASRLIHGGLRYLEYGEFRLVRESLDERTRLHDLAPQFVQPLRLGIPVTRRTGGLIRSTKRFFFGSTSGAPGERGLWLVRLGLWFYDRFVKDKSFPKADTLTLPAENAPGVSRRFRWMCAYTDAQMRYPERFVLSMLTDARQAAEQSGIPFQVLTYHQATLNGKEATISPLHNGDSFTIQPDVIVNATGAWGDLTLDELNVTSPKLFGGTKGSHFLTYHTGLRESLGETGIYAEAADGRLVFVLPFGHAVLVGTTDVRFNENPGEAVATDEELSYLIDMVNDLFEDVSLTTDDITMHYAGVRPLPATPKGSTSAISRDHHLEWNDKADVPVVTLVGGKLTTARAFGELAADEVMEKLGVSRDNHTRERGFPGANGSPFDAPVIAGALADRFSLPPSSAMRVVELCGMQAEEVLTAADQNELTALPGTDLPVAVARWAVEHEWATTLDDLVERRLMLLYEPEFSEECLRELAEVLVSCGRLRAGEVPSAIQSTISRLQHYYGRQVATSTLTPTETS